MNREKAVSVFKEILNACDGGVTPSIAIMSSNNRASSGYQLHVNSFSDKICIESISNRNNLELIDREGLLVIYSPKSQ